MTGRSEPVIKRAIAFVDGQNLFHAARAAFGHRYPNYDPLSLAEIVAIRCGWRLDGTQFYTGVPDAVDGTFWNHFWTAKLQVLGSRGVVTYSRPLRYQISKFTLPDGTETSRRVGHEKGIDIRLALDVVRLARENRYDVALLFSQDQDLSEAVDEVRAVSLEQNRWIKVACAFPIGPGTQNVRGINGTDWIKIHQADYDRCLDPNEYRPKP